MKRILSIDPGHTTGIAVYDKDGQLEFSMAAPAKTIQIAGFFLDLVGFCRPEIILIEDLPKNYVDALTQQVWSHIAARVTVLKPKVKIVQIKPAQWKGFAERVEIPGQHARDAATMAKWWIEKEELK